MPNIAVLARVGAHRDFIRLGMEEIEVQVVRTPFGESAPMHLFEHERMQFAVMSRNGEEMYSLASPSVNYRANIWALKEIGVERIFSWSAPGAINERFPPGDVVITDDLIDETRGRTYTFFEGKGMGFIRQNPVFCPEVACVVEETLSELDVRHHVGGTYVCTQGPRLETPAEIRKYKIYGGDLVGMMMVPEVFLARELEMCYGAACYVVNYAEGIRSRSHHPEILFGGMLDPEEKPKVDEIEARFAEIACSVVKGLNETHRTCVCRDLMSRYKIRGDAGADWHTWIE